MNLGDDDGVDDKQARCHLKEMPSLLGSKGIAEVVPGEIVVYTYYTL